MFLFSWEIARTLGKFSSKTNMAAAVATKNSANQKPIWHNNRDTVDQHSYALLMKNWSVKSSETSEAVTFLLLFVGLRIQWVRPKKCSGQESNKICCWRRFLSVAYAVRKCLQESTPEREKLFSRVHFHASYHPPTHRICSKFSLRLPINSIQRVLAKSSVKMTRTQRRSMRNIVQSFFENIILKHIFARHSAENRARDDYWGHLRHSRLWDSHEMQLEGCWWLTSTILFKLQRLKSKIFLVFTRFTNDSHLTKKKSRR